jgi:hypothetical protein
MMHSSLHETGGEVGMPPNTGDSNVAEEVELSPERKGAIVALAKEIIAGRINPPALVVTPEIERFLKKEFGSLNPPPTPEAIRRITERLSLQAHYGGRPVACFTTVSGDLAGLAAGESEIETLLRGLSNEETAQVIVTDSE